MGKQASKQWIAVALGNSRGLWGCFEGDRLQQWQRCPSGRQPDWNVLPDTEIVVAEVGAPERRSPLFNSPSVTFLTRQAVPLTGQYDTLGLDRSLALLGAVERWGAPTMVIDGGTALTISTVNEGGEFAGGAIVPGGQLQGKALHDYTAALPAIDFADVTTFPDRWALTTDGAIRSGIFYGLLATVKGFSREWRDRYPLSPLVLTGGDGELLQQALCDGRDAIENCFYDPVLVLRGISICHRTGGLRRSADSAS